MNRINIPELGKALGQADPAGTKTPLFTEGAHAAAESDLDLEALRRSQVAQMRDALWVAIAGTTGVCVVFALLHWAEGFDSLLMPWLGLGICASGLRTALWLATRHALPRSDKKVRLFLGMAVLAAALAGAMFAYAWLALPAKLTAFGWAALMFANLALLFGGLFAYGACLPAFLAFAWPSMLGALAGLWWLPLSMRDLSAASLGLGLVLGVSTLFAVRSASTFRTALGLRQRVTRLFEEVSNKRDEAVSATLAKSRFLASVSHDLRQPLHAINLYLSSVVTSHQRHLLQPDEASHGLAVQEGLSSLRDSALYLNEMFESLLDISRLDAGTVSVAIRPVPLVRLMSQLQSDYTQLAEAEGLRFDVRLPAQFKLMEVQTDPALLERLLRNLIINAIRYTESGGVRMSVVARGRQLDFRVVDTGPGIDRGMRERIFEEFFQVPGSQIRAQRQAHTGRGIGLGLSISARLADKLNTRIRLRSWPGRGSVFALRQPMRIVLRPVAEPSSIQRIGGTFPAGTFIAVIDDDLEIRRSSQTILEQMGAEVFTADSGAKAINQLGRLGRVPSVVLCDYRLVDENGLDVIQALRDEFNEDVPAILITGDTSPEHVTEFRTAGVQVLHKPVPGDRLLAAVHHELERVSSAAP